MHLYFMQICYSSFNPEEEEPESGTCFLAGPDQR